MKFPRPAPKAYLKATLLYLLIIAVLQYTGFYFENPAGTIDWGILLGIGVLMPLFTYLATVLAENVEGVSWGERMNRTEKR